jgi:CIC family chloride channel protein
VTLAVVGMCACLGAVVRAPVTGILIVFEMTHEFALVPVLMIGALVSQMIGRRLTHENFYEAVLAQDGQHVDRLVPPRSLRTWMELPVARIANFSPIVARDLSSTALEELLARHPYDRFPVVENDRLAGIVTRREAAAAAAAQRPPALEPAVTCRPGTPLREVADLIVTSPSGLLVIQDEVGATGRVIGVITMHDILRAQKMFARDQGD